MTSAQIAASLALLVAAADAATAPAFATGSKLPLSLGRTQATCSQVQMGLLSTVDFPPYAPKVLFSRRIARLLNKNCVQEKAAQLSDEVDAALTKSESALASGDIEAAKAGLSAALEGLDKLGSAPSAKIGLTSLPGRAYCLQESLQ